MQQPNRTSPTSSNRTDATALLAALEEARNLYGELLELVRARREAVRVADLARFTKLADGESRILARLSELDRVRVAEARALATRLALPADASLAAGPFQPGTGERRFRPLLDAALAGKVVESANFDLVERLADRFERAIAPNGVPAT